MNDIFDIFMYAITYKSVGGYEREKYFDRKTSPRIEGMQWQYMSYLETVIPIGYRAKLYDVHHFIMTKKASELI